MIPVKWQPFEERLSLRREMDRLFDNFLGTEFKSTTNGNWLPEIDMSETDDEIIVKMDIPGMEQKDIKVAMSGDYLNVTGERKEEKEEKKKHYYSLERKLGMFERNIPIPTAVDPVKIKAEYNKGVLEVHLPRTPEAKPYRIPVTTR
jgi:HSP20 family protein